MTAGPRASRLRSVSESPDYLLLKEGSLTLDQYLEHRVERAIAHLVGRVTEQQLEQVRIVVRDQLLTDPVVKDLVKSATGHLPEPSETP